MRRKEILPQASTRYWTVPTATTGTSKTTVKDNQGGNTAFKSMTARTPKALTATALVIAAIASATLTALGMKANPQDGNPELG